VHDDDVIERVATRVLQRLAPGAAAAHEREFVHWTRDGDRHDDPSCAVCSGRGECARRRPVTLRRIVAAGACRVAQRFPGGPVEDDLAVCIDHTLLRPEATYAQVQQLCREAAEYHFASVCINPVHVADCAALLRGTGVAVCTVVGFPLGATTTEVKVFETRQAVERGAAEIDMVIHVGALKSGDLEAVYTDIRSVAQACGGQTLLKVIIEAALLDDEEKVRACVVSRRAGADFVKTSTGFGPGGATLHDVDLMRRTVGDELGVKAAGGIRDRATAEQMIAAGADRVGASASVKILRERDAARP
jgi:deoxyribose-phosphate aldolase